MFEQKLHSIVNSVRLDYALSAPVSDCVYRNAASFCHLRHGQQAAFAKPVKSALQPISLSDIADRDWCQRQAVACLEPVFIQDSGGIDMIVVVQKAVHFGYHGGILSVALSRAQRLGQQQRLGCASAEADVELNVVAISDCDVLDQQSDHSLALAIGDHSTGAENRLLRQGPALAALR